MRGSIVAYHDYWDDRDTVAAFESGDMTQKANWEIPKAHRTWIADLLKTPDYILKYRPKFFTEVEGVSKAEHIGRKWLYDIGIIQKVGRESKDVI